MYNYKSKHLLPCAKLNRTCQVSTLHKSPYTSKSTVLSNSSREQTNAEKSFQVLLTTVYSLHRLKLEIIACLNLTIREVSRIKSDGKHWINMTDYIPFSPNKIPTLCVLWVYYPAGNTVPCWSCLGTYR